MDVVLGRTLIKDTAWFKWKFWTTFGKSADIECETTWSPWNRAKCKSTIKPFSSSIPSADFKAIKKTVFRAPRPSSIQSCILSLEIAGRMETIYEPSGNTCSQYSSPPAHQEILEQPFCRKQKKIWNKCHAKIANLQIAMASLFKEIIF